MIAIPTTAGTGSETTGTSIFDYEEMHVKTGIAHRALRPVMGIIDPDNTRTLPRMVAACTGLDVLSHALESLTALPYTQRAAPEHPRLRPAYQGSNPISDIWASRAIEMCARYLVRAVQDAEDDEARSQMLLAAAIAGIGFGNAGVHLPHGMAYPVAGMVRDYWPEGYHVDHPLVPHGMAVIVNAPAVFRFTAPTDPELHLQAAALMGVDTRGATPGDAGELVAGALVEMMRATGMPNGLAALGYGPDDVDQLVAGTLPQHRVTKLSPRPASAEELRGLFLDSMTCW
jgi:hydroxyacid-oxoacid transhydrogenase